jgi:RNA polymerase sigma factor (sigma-70 family)
MSNEENHINSLVLGCLKNSRQEQRALYELFYGYGLKISFRYAQNREEATEILNDAFLKVFNKIHQYDTTQPFKAWFRRVLIHAAIDYHRVHHKLTKLIELEANHYLESEELPLPILTLDENVLPLLQALPPQYRLVFNLFVMEEYNHKEIAAQLGITESTSRSNLARAKEKLKEMILNQKPQNGQLAYKKYIKTGF